MTREVLKQLRGQEIDDFKNKTDHYPAQKTRTRTSKQSVAWIKGPTVSRALSEILFYFQRNSNVISLGILLIKDSHDEAKSK